MTYDTVITNSHVILPQGMLDKNIIIDEGKIVGFTNDIPSCDKKINGNGLISIPGPIDTYVHYGVYSPNVDDVKEAITDDSTEGDCSTIGTWESVTKTCTLKILFLEIMNNNNIK